MSQPPSLDDPNKPRKLTSEEIADILSVVPSLKSAADQVSVYNHQSMLNTLKDQLKEMIVTPLAIPDIKSEFLRNFNHSLIKAGTAVGVTAAEAIGGPITQGALNSFHQSGSSKNVTYGVSRFRELLNASEKLKTTSCSIYFKNQNLSFEDVVTRVRPRLTQINVKDIVNGVPDIESFDQIEQPWWYEPYKLLVRSDFQSKSVLRLSIDVDMLYAYKIDMEDIAKVIEHDQDQSVICVYSPMNIGEIHIYPIEQNISSKISNQGIIGNDNASLIFLWEIVIPKLDQLKITGVEGIRQIYPVDAMVWQIVKEEQPAGKYWHLILNHVRMKITGITADKLIHLCKTVGIKIIKVDTKSEPPRYITVETPNGESPTLLINRTIKQDEEDKKEYEQNRRKEKARIIRRPPTEISTASKLVYADSDGSLFKGNSSTLRELLAHPDIDSTRTYCNNVHEIKEVLGLEAARSFLIKEFSDLIEYEGAYVNPRHIVLLIDFMVSLGEVKGLTFTGISGQTERGALEKASFEKAMDTFKEASAFGENTEIKGTSASIYVGKRAEIGTGFNDAYIDQEQLKLLEKELNDDSDMMIDIGDFKDAIGEMNDIISGADFTISEGAEEEMFGGEQTFPPASLLPTDAPAPSAGNMETIKGPLIRAPELEEASLKLNEAPCLSNPRPRTTHVESVPSTVGQTTTVLPSVVETELGLPESILGQMKQLQHSQPSTILPSVVSELPTAGLPPPVSSLPPPVSSLPPPSGLPAKQPIQTVPTAEFNLESFLN